MNWNAVATLAPLLTINALFLLGLPVFAVYTARHGLPVDARVEQRRSALIGRFLQHYLLWLLRPIERALIAWRVPPDALTAGSVVLSAAAAVTLGRGSFALGGWLYALTGIADICDGRVARATDRVSDAGAYADSVADRLAEAAIFSGLAWYYRGTWVLLLVLGALVASFLVSYARARGEGLGVVGADVGAMQRPERILFLGLGMIFSPIVDLFLPAAAVSLHWAAVAGLALVALASFGTALRRFGVVYRALGRRAPAPVRALRPLKGAPKTPAPAAAEGQPAVTANAGPR